MLDFSISLIALIIISPILLVVTIWLHFANKGAGAFFFQERPGKDAKIKAHVAALSFVIRDVKAGTTVMGNPAKKLI